MDNTIKMKIRVSKMAMQEMTHRGGRTLTMASYQNGDYQNGGYQNGGYQNNSYQNNGYNGQPQYNYQGNNSPGRGYSIACLILGICGIVFCFCYGIVGVICSIVALVLHGKAVELDGFESATLRLVRSVRSSEL